MTESLEYATKGFCDIIDITGDVARVIEKARLREGNVLLFVLGSTAALTTLEYEPALLEDVKKFFEKILPRSASYAHDATWGDANGFSHLRSMLVKTSLTVPFLKGQMTLGRWQQVVLIDFDNNPRQRRVVVQLQGVE
ncbi:MAG: secondary thiamine-phosphate synthase enzyme YjbQ [Deltaproteobacteria bacterium]